MKSVLCLIIIALILPQMMSNFGKSSPSTEVAASQIIMKRVENRGWKFVNNEVEYMIVIAYKQNAKETFQKIVGWINQKVNDIGLAQKLDDVFTDFTGILKDNDIKRFNTVDHVRHVVNIVRLGYWKKPTECLIAYKVISLSFETMPVLMKISSSSQKHKSRKFLCFGSSSSYSQSSETFVEVARGLQADDLVLMDQLADYGAEKLSKQITNFKANINDDDDF